MTIDLVNILDRFLPLKTLEMAFQSMKISKFSGKACPQTPPPPSGSSVIKKKYDFMYLQSWTVFLSLLTWYRLETLITYFTQRSTPLKEKNTLDN